MHETFPPPGFIPTESRLPGIEVYRPAPTEVGRRPIVDFKCPRCGANTAYSLETGDLTCTYCGFSEHPNSHIVGKTAEEFEFKLETLKRAARGWGGERKQLECQNCGAQTSLPPDSLTHACPFCGSNRVLQRPDPSDSLQPRFLIPFKITPEACLEIFRRWVGESWMTPYRLRKIAEFDRLSAIYLPFWTFDSTARASWRAQVGHQVTDRYYDHGSKSWKTRTRIEWRWESGRVRLPFDDVLVEGTERVQPELMAKIDDYAISQLVAYDPRYLAGMQALAYDLPLETAWERARRRMRERTREACRAQASTARIRSFSMTMDFDEEAWRYILLPAYLAAYDYSGERYQVVINGQTGTIAGSRPADWRKIWLVIAALLGPALLLGLGGLLAMPFFGPLPTAIGFGLSIAALIASIVILVRASKLDDI
jgi:DNA-directed RNA polymerase subunit RPC12/RpoP